MNLEFDCLLNANEEFVDVLRMHVQSIICKQLFAEQKNKKQNKSLLKYKIGPVTLSDHHNNDKATSTVISSRRERRLGV